MEHQFQMLRTQLHVLQQFLRERIRILTFYLQHVLQNYFEYMFLKSHLMKLNKKYLFIFILSIATFPILFILFIYFPHPFQIIFTHFINSLKTLSNVKATHYAKVFDMLDKLTNVQAFLLMLDFDDESFVIKCISSLLSIPKYVFFNYIF